MVCGGNTPPKGPYTEHEPQKRAERGFARPYGIPYGILAVLVEYRTVLNGRAKSGGVLGDRRARDGCSRRPTVESLRPYGGSSCAFANDQSPGKGEPHRRLRSRNLVCSEPWGFQYGLAKSRTENRQVMGCVGNSYADCRCGPPLPDGLQKSWYDQKRAPQPVRSHLLGSTDAATTERKSPNRRCMKTRANWSLNTIFYDSQRYDRVLFGVRVLGRLLSILSTHPPKCVRKIDTYIFP